VGRLLNGLDQGMVKDVDVGKVTDVAVGMAKAAAVDTAKDVYCDNFPRCRNEYHKYTVKNNNKDNTVNNQSACMEACTSRDCNNRVTWSHIHTD